MRIVPCRPQLSITFDIDACAFALFLYSCKALDLYFVGTLFESRRCNRLMHLVNILGRMFVQMSG
jgi:hypothetical protein